MNLFSVLKNTQLAFQSNISFHKQKNNANVSFSLVYKTNRLFRKEKKILLRWFFSSSMTSIARKIGVQNILLRSTSSGFSDGKYMNEGWKYLSWIHCLTEFLSEFCQFTSAKLVAKWHSKKNLNSEQNENIFRLANDVAISLQRPRIC